MKKISNLGDIVSIQLKNKTFAYARSLQSALYGFYDYFTEKEEINLEEIINKKILFIFPVISNALKNENWKKLKD
jgi:hypothetical protein